MTRPEWQSPGLCPRAAGGREVGKGRVEGLDEMRVCRPAVVHWAERQGAGRRGLLSQVRTQMVLKRGGNGKEGPR